MKARMLGAIALMATTLFVACDKKPGETAVTGITVSPTEVSLDAANPSVRLSYTLQPSGAKGDVVWSSSDTAIAKVNANTGYVEAKDFGTCNVIATCGQYSAACKVTVKTYLENLSFTGATIGDLDTLYYGGKDTVIQSSGGGSYTVTKSQAKMYIMSDGFYLNESGYFDGTTNGTIIEINAPLYYGPASKNKGQAILFLLGTWAVSSKYPAGTIHLAAPGEINDAGYLKAMQGFVNAVNAATTQEAFTAAYDYLDSAEVNLIGTKIYTLTYHSTTEGYPQDGYYNPMVSDGVIPEALLSLNGDGVTKYMYGMDYNVISCLPLDNIDYEFGCNWKYTEAQNYFGATISWLDTQIHKRDPIEYTYGTIPAESAKIKPIKACVLAWDYPEVAEQLQKQLQNREVLRIKK